MKKNYLIYAGAYNMPKNSLQKAIQAHVAYIDRLIVSGDDLTKFKSDFDKQINHLNKVASRCTPEKSSWFNPGREGKNSDIQNHVGGITMHLYEIKGNLFN